MSHLGSTPAAAAEISALWEEYEKAETPEALLVKDLDKFEMIVQALEYEESTLVPTQPPASAGVGAATYPRGTCTCSYAEHSGQQAVGRVLQIDRRQVCAPAGAGMGRGAIRAPQGTPRQPRLDRRRLRSTTELSIILCTLHSYTDTVQFTRRHKGTQEIQRHMYSCMASMHSAPAPPSKWGQDAAQNHVRVVCSVSA